MNEDVQDAEDGWKRGEDSPLGGWRVATTGPALSLAMGDGGLCPPVGCGLPCARTPTIPRMAGVWREDDRRCGDACGAPRQSREEERRRLTGGPGQ